MDYQQASAKLGTARNRDAGKPLANNTRLVPRGECIAVRLHETDILTFDPSGAVTLNSGGWKTPTTKDRINGYMPSGFCISQEKGSWFVRRPGQWDKPALAVFADGMRILSDGAIVGALPLTAAKDEQKTRKAILKYARTFVDALHAGKIDAPSMKDCLMCQMGRDIPEHRDASHILSHMEESYYVPTLLLNALESFGASVAVKQTAHAYMSGALRYAFSTDSESFVFEQMQKVIRRYCLRQLGMPA